MYVLSATTRNATRACDLRDPVEERPAFSTIRYIGHVNSDFFLFTQKSRLPIWFIAKLALGRTHGIEKYVYPETQSRDFSP